MSKFNNIHKLTTASAIGAAAIFTMLSFGGSAEASGNVLNCQGPTANSVINCCKEMTREGLPLWMRQTATSCNIAAECRGKKGGIPGIATITARRCYIVNTLMDSDSHELHKKGGDKGRFNS